MCLTLILIVIIFLFGILRLGTLGGGGGSGSELGKRKNRFLCEDDNPGCELILPFLCLSINSLKYLLLLPLVGSVQRKKIYIPSGGDINYLGKLGIAVKSHLFLSSYTYPLCLFLPFHQAF